MLKSSNSLLAKLVRTFSILSIVTIALVAIYAYNQAKENIEESIYSKLELSIIVEEKNLSQWFESQYQDILLLAEVSNITEPVELLVNRQSSQVKSQGYQQLDKFLKNLKDLKPALHEISIIDNSGNIILSTNKLLEGTYQPLSNTVTYLTADAKNVKPTFYKSNITGQTEITLATPILDSNQKTLGTLSIDLNLQEINQLIQEQTGLGTTGETYLIGTLETQNSFLFLEDKALLEEKYPNGVSSLAIDRAIGGENGYGLYSNYDGVPVIGVFNWLESQKLALLAEINQKEAFAPARKIALNMALFGLAASVFVLVGIYLLAKRITTPVKELTAAASRLASGDLDYQTNINSKDEIGILAHAFNQMAQKLKESFRILETKVKERTIQLNQLLEQQKVLAEEQRQQKEQLETAIYTLIEEVSDATEGDLTVRASLDSLEISTVADLFNAIIDNLQQIAIEAKDSTSQVGSSLKQNEEAIRLLAEQAMAEAEETRETLISVEQMSQSIQVVAENASQAEAIADDTYNTVLNSTNDMDLTVDSILQLRTTVGETAKKMKRLGESSQKISQVVSFIEEIAGQTHLLAINASLEARRAGEYGQGFTMVAEQIDALAEQSAAATQEIAKIVTTIQGETREVSQAMESGTTQVVESTNLVESTKQSLSLVLEKSQAIHQLMSSISQTTISQANTSQNLTQLMQKIAQLSEATSSSSQKVAQSIVATAAIAKKLESDVARFKVALV